MANERNQSHEKASVNNFLEENRQWGKTRITRRVGIVEIREWRGESEMASV